MNRVVEDLEDSGSHSLLKSNHSEVKLEGPFPTQAENLTPVPKKLALIKNEKTPLRALLTANTKK